MLYQGIDADLTTWGGLTPSANFQTLVVQTFAQMRASLDLEAGTDFYSVSAADAAFEAELNNSAGLLAALSDETGTGVAVFNISPNLRGKILLTGTAVNDDDCTGEQGSIWYDSTDSAFEICNENSGTPITIGSGGATGTVDGADVDIAGTTVESTIASDDEILIYDTSAAANRSMTRGNFVSGIGAGQAIVLDLGDDGGNDSTDVGEIAVTGDTNSIFTEPTADKLLIAVGNNWPTADLSTTVTIADNEATDEDNAVLFTPGGDVDGGNLTPESDGDLTYNPSTGTLTATIFAIGDAAVSEAELEILDGATVTTTQLNYVDVTSSIQDQINLKAPLDSPTFTTAASLVIVTGKHLHNLIE